VDPGGAAAGDELEANRQHREENLQDLGWGARLYLGVLLVVGLSGVVSFIRLFARPLLLISFPQCFVFCKQREAGQGQIQRSTRNMKRLS